MKLQASGLLRKKNMNIALVHMFMNLIVASLLGIFFSRDYREYHQLTSISTETIRKPVFWWFLGE